MEITRFGVHVRNFYFYSNKTSLKKLFLNFLLFIIAYNASTQPPVVDTCGIRISLLTCTPGDELYTTFGHSALRVIDRRDGTEAIFNYGTFDFEDPIKFYKNFVKGKLLYYVSLDNTNRFLAEYDHFGRGVTEQVLNLTCDEKDRFVKALFENAKEENKYYRYDFNYDNCTTRLRDMLEKATGKTLQTTIQLTSSETTFRDLIHEYLDKGHQYWSKLGIDILLGSPLDTRVTNREAMFLPDYLMLAFDSSSYNGKPLVEEKLQLLPQRAASEGIPFFTPLIVFGIVWLIIALLGLVKSRGVTIFLNVFDTLFFFLCGLMGVLLLFMWFGTEHAMARNNFNLLWALPTHLVAAPLIMSNKQWVKKYFYITSLYCLGLLAAWFFLPQGMNNALLPIVAIMLVRSAVISKRK